MVTLPLFHDLKRQNQEFLSAPLKELSTFLQKQTTPATSMYTHSWTLLRIFWHMCTLTVALVFKHKGGMAGFNFFSVCVCVYK